MSRSSTFSPLNAEVTPKVLFGQSKKEKKLFNDNHFTVTPRLTNLFFNLAYK